MSNTIRLYVEDPDGVLATGNYDAGAILRVHWCATEAGVYANLTTVPIVSGIRSYVVFDIAGTASTFYRTRYENVAGTITSEWSTAFQTGISEGLCELADVRQRLGIAYSDTTSDEDLAEFISAVSTEIMGYTGRYFMPDPPSGTVAYVFDIEEPTRTLYIPRGVRSVTTLGYATTDQPDTAGTYTTLAATYYHLRPATQDRSYGWPATRIELDTAYQFYPGRSTVSVTGAFGFAAVPPDIGNIATNAVVRMFQAKRSATQTADLVLGSADTGYRILAFLSPAERGRLDWYRAREVA